MSSSRHPPELDLQLGSKITTLAMLNVVPLICTAWLLVALHRGDIAVDKPPPSAWVPFAVTMFLAGSLTLMGWVVYPYFAWLREHALWYRRNGSAFGRFFWSVGSVVALVAKWIMAGLAMTVLLLTLLSVLWTVIAVITYRQNRQEATSRDTVPICLTRGDNAPPVPPGSACGPLTTA